jgi:uncharacterized protein (TIGR00369 family)
MTKMLDLIEKMVRGEAPPPPVASLVGFRLVSIERGQSVMELEATERHSNPMGTLHGGILCDIADAAMGMACASTLEEGETFTTLEIKINFLKPMLSAVGRIVKEGRTISLAECNITDESEQLMAFATSTCMTLRGEQAQGRQVHLEKSH